MRKRARGQVALIPVTTRVIPPWRLLDGDSALRSGVVRRARGAMRNMEFCARNIDGWPHWPECVIHLDYWRREDTVKPHMSEPWAYTVCRAGVRFESVDTWGGWDSKPANLICWNQMAGAIADDPRRSAIQEWAASLIEPCWRDLARPYEMWPNPEQWHPHYTAGDHSRPGWPARHHAWSLTLAILGDAAAQQVPDGGSTTRHDRSETR